MEAVRRNPRAAESFGELGRLYHGSEFYDLAGQAFQIAAELDPDSATWQYYLGAMASRRGENEEAVARFRETARLIPDYAPVYLRLGDSLLASGKLDEAEEAYRVFSSRKPDQPWGWVGLGKVAHRRGDLDRVVSELERAVEIAPPSKETCYLLAMSYGALGRKEEANRYLELFGTAPAAKWSDPRMETIRRSSPGLNSIFRRANAALQTGDLDRAERLYREILTHDGDHFGALVNLGNLLGRRGQPEEAFEVLAQAVSLEPSHPHARFGLAMALVALSRLEEGMAELDRVLEIDPDHAAAQTLRQRLSAAGVRPPS
jgi:tetratricopeptide (TPR) repeat protein